jgi:translation initiation factor IF-2
VTTRGVTGQITPESDARWKVENKPGREVIQSQLAAASAPSRVSRAMVATTGATGRGAAGSTIVFDKNEGRFVNSSNARVGDGPPATAAEANKATEPSERAMKAAPAPGRGGNDARVPPAGNRMNARELPGRQTPPAARNAPAPPSVPRSVAHERASNPTGGGGQAGGRGMGSAGGGASAGASRGSVPSAGAGAPSGGARSSGGTSSGGGRPH